MRESGIFPWIGSVLCGMFRCKCERERESPVKGRCIVSHQPFPRKCSVKWNFWVRWQLVEKWCIRCWFTERRGGKSKTRNHFRWYLPKSGGFTKRNWYKSSDSDDARSSQHGVFGGADIGWEIPNNDRKFGALSCIR